MKPEFCWLGFRGPDCNVIAEQGGGPDSRPSWAGSGPRAGSCPPMAYTHRAYFVLSPASFPEWISSQDYTCCFCVHVNKIPFSYCQFRQGVCDLFGVHPVCYCLSVNFPSRLSAALIDNSIFHQLPLSFQSVSSSMPALLALRIFASKHVSVLVFMAPNLMFTRDVELYPCRTYTLLYDYMFGM